MENPIGVAIEQGKLNLPKDLEKVSIIKFEDLLEVGAKLYTLGGQESIGFIVPFRQFGQLTGGDPKDFFVKLYTTNPDITNEVIADILRKTGARPLGDLTLEDAAKELGGNEKNKDYEEQIIRAALGLKYGHEALPGDTPDLSALITYKGKLAGSVCVFVEGEAKSIYPNDLRISILETVEVEVDLADGTQNEVGGKLIDLRFTGKLIF